MGCPAMSILAQEAVGSVSRCMLCLLACLLQQLVLHANSTLSVAKVGYAPEVGPAPLSVPAS